MTNVKNISQAIQGVHTKMGTDFLQPGQTKNLNFDKGHFERASELAKAGLLQVEGFEETDEPTSFVEPATAASYEAKHKGGQYWSIFNGDEEVKKGLSKEEAETFNGLDADGKAAYLAA